MKRPAVQRDTRPQWQCLIVAYGEKASADRHVQKLLNDLAESGHEVTMAHVDRVGVPQKHALRRPS